MDTEERAGIWVLISPGIIGGLIGFFFGGFVEVIMGICIAYICFIALMLVVTVYCESGGL